MDANSTFQEDLELFRRLMRVLIVLENGNSIDQLLTPPPSINRRPAPAVADIQRWRHGTELQAGAMEEMEEPVYDGEKIDNDDDDDEDDEDDEDDDDEDDEDDDDDDDEEGGDDDEEDDEDDDEDDDDEEELDENGDGGDGGELPEHCQGLQLPGGPIDLISAQDSINVLSDQQPPNSAAPYSPNPAKKGARLIDQDADDDADLRCWDHDCNGRKFTTRSNLKRHRRERSPARLECRCPRCNAAFSRTTARNTHVARGSCNRIRRYSNGRIRVNTKAKDSQT